MLYSNLVNLTALNVLKMCKNYFSTIIFILGAILPHEFCARLVSIVCEYVLASDSISSV